MDDTTAYTHGDSNDVARHFHAVIREWLPEHLHQIDAKNAANSLGICATHDLCDSNMAMAEAFERHGLDPFDVECASKAALWAQAWNIAIHVGFAHPFPTTCATDDNV